MIQPGILVPFREDTAAGEAARTLLHITAPAAYGGLERVVSALALGQVSAGHRVNVAAVTSDNGPAAFFDELSAGGVHVHVFRVPARAYRRERRELAQLCARIRPDVVHTHGYHADIVGGAAAARMRVPRISTVHGFTGGDWRNRLYEASQRRVLRGFDAVVAVSRPIASTLATSGVEMDRLHVFPNAFADDTDPWDRAAARAFLGLAADRVHLGWVGRLSAEKGCDIAIDALAKLNDPNIELSIIGDGAERAELERRAARAGVAQQIRWHGALPRVAHLYGAFDAFVLSSRTEGTPIVLFEAIAAGVPVIATAVGGVPDVVSREEALLVRPDSPDALAWGIHETLHADRAGATARAGRASARLRTHFDVVPWLAGYDSLYRTLVTTRT